MIIPWLVALGIAGAGGYIIARRRSATREAGVRRRLEEEKRKELAAAGVNGPVPTPLPQEGYREPDPAAMINTPIDAEDFRQMQEAFCICYRALLKDGGKPPSMERLRDCFLTAIYPDFTWPPVPGDPATAQLMWMIANHEARKLLTDPSSCASASQLGKDGGPS